ncbi:MAG: hypothetical protein R6X08_02565 [Desulfosalsimonadaceae bacterium]
MKSSGGSVFFRVLVVFLLILAGVFGGALFYGSKTIHDLFDNNRRLKQAIANLTQSDQIGYAKVLAQEEKNGTLYTTLRFVETARDNKQETVLTRQYTIKGDVVHFDALIVKFSDQMVMSGEKRALYLWRRVYGEKMAPSEGYPIEVAARAPGRYADLLDELPAEDQEMFWDAIWRLANDPDALKEHGIRAIYGNAVYKKLRPGLIYVFKISPTGHVYPETVPDL